MPSNTLMDLFAVTAPGLESIALGELKRLGLKGKAEEGGVSYKGNAEAIYTSNLWLRTASRVVVRVARFHASTFHELERRARQVPWLEFLPANSAVRVRATCRKSRLYHSDAVAQRVLDAIARVAPQAIAPENEPAQLFVVRIVDDQCEISADTSGELLHRRGYRVEVAKAPLRETLAAAMLLASGWRPAEPLLDPMCGSGTIPIEAALLARGIAPGLHRGFAFMDWPTFQKATWERAVESAIGTDKRASGDQTITGADRDDGAIEAARRNAERAGVASDLRFAVRPLSASLHELERVDRPGWVLTNPPYGVRVGDPDALRNLYAKLGTAVKSAEGWKLGILTSDTQLSRQMGLPMRARFSTSKGGIPVAFFAQEKTSAGGRPVRVGGVRQNSDGN